MRKHCIYSGLFFYFIFSHIATAQAQKTPPDLDKTQLIYAANFDNDLASDWVIEMEPLPNSNIYTKDDNLILDTKGGVTVWYKTPLIGNYVISYKRGFILEDRSNDRLSDLNQFWLAKDLKNKNLFARTGRFEDYNDLKLWYMGMGGNYNSTTRFRHYNGKGQRIVLKEHLDKDWLLKPDHEYEILTLVKDGTTRVWVDGRLFFEAALQENNPTGYFGLRSTFSRQVIKDFKIYQLH